MFPESGFLPIPPDCLPTFALHCQGNCVVVGPAGWAHRPTLPGGGETPDTARFQISLRLNVKLRSGANQNDFHSFYFQRELRVVQMLPPVSAKFTLFVRETPASPEAYNTQVKSFQSDFGPSLVLFNHPNQFAATDGQTAWQKSGWVYLGNGTSIMNLDGTHPCRPESEYVLFWPDLLNSTSIRAEVPQVCLSSWPSYKVKVRFTPMGAYTEAATFLQTSIGATDPGVLPQLTRPSWLRLFGGQRPGIPRRLTPTRILGDVRCRYVLYSSLFYDSDGDSLPDIIDFGNGIIQKASFALPRLLTPPTQFPTDVHPTIHTRQGVTMFPDLVQRPGITGMPATLLQLMPAFNAGGTTDFVTFMTKLNTDFQASSGLSTFNSLYDLVYDLAQTNKRFPALKILHPNDYPNPATAVTVPCDWSGVGGSLFQGSLATFDPAQRFNDPKIFTHQFPNGQDFVNAALEGPANGPRQLTQPVVAKIQGDLQLLTACSRTSSPRCSRTSRPVFRHY